MHLLESLVGRTVTVIDPESLEDAPVGRRIHASLHRAEVIAICQDYIVLAGDFVHRSAGAVNGKATEKIRHYVPVDKIQRVSVLAKELMIHL